MSSITGEKKDDNEVAQSVLEEDTSRSLAATLKLIRAKGYVDRDVKRPSTSSGISSSKRAKIEAKSVVEERRSDGGDRGGRGDGSRSRGRGEQLRVVLDPEDYKPEIKLEYTDDAGRPLEKTKDQYKYICYKFHGHGPGKNKTDKRLRQQAMEAKMKQALTTELPTSASLMISKQKELHTPGIVLSKGNH